MLKNRYYLLIAFAGVLLLFIVCMNEFILRESNKEEKPLSIVEKKQIKNVKTIYSSKDCKAYLVDEDGSIVFGPCEIIYDDSNCEKIFRFVSSSNNLIGYGQVTDECVEVLAPAVFSQASSMEYEAALVREKDRDTVYFIDRNGDRFTDDYKAAYSFAESQGSYARVQNKDATWSIINKQGVAVLKGFDSINKLHFFESVGTGIIDGKAVLFKLNDSDGHQSEIIQEYPEFIEIADPGDGSDIAIVKNINGKQGVLNVWTGETIIPTVYENIQWGYIQTDATNKDGTDTKRIHWFNCINVDGTIDVKYWSLF